tara:strand:+ start:69 stop:869 length:801 start_codon:yes stop_codon:yes gene_type:complete
MRRRDVSHYRKTETLSFNDLDKWYQVNKKTNNMKFLKIEDKSTDNIFLNTQFYLPKDEERQQEIKYCLKQNIQYFNKIFLLNERIYSLEELGLTEEENQKITQINIKKRLTYEDWLEHSKTLNGFTVLANSDIFFDETIENIRSSCLSKIRGVESILRHEFIIKDGETIKHLDSIRLTHDFSQDVWILHTNFIPDNLKDFDFFLGISGCDVHFNYLMNKLNYYLFNDCHKIKNYHYHAQKKPNPDFILEKQYFGNLPSKKEEVLLK